MTVTLDQPTESPSAGPWTRRGRRWIVATGAVTALLGATTVAGASYWASVELPGFADLPETSSVYYSDGTLLANIGSVDRVLLDYEDIAPIVTQVAVAAEDPEFWTSDTGPITRTAVRQGVDLGAGGTRLWIQSQKASDRYSKQEILADYLNAVPFGRGTYGIEAAARAYFHKTASVQPPAGYVSLTRAEAMVLVGLVRQPYPDATDPSGSPGFDPASSPAAEANSRRRFGEIRDALVATGALTQQDASALDYPMPMAPIDGPVGRPDGVVLDHVLAELTQSPDSPLRGRTWQSIADSGFQITTTLDARVQAALESVADERVAGSVMAGQPERLQAAGVVVEPGTGRVLGYYGGSNPSGADYAGVVVAEDGTVTGFGAHPPGSAFLVHTLAAALHAGYSLNSRWLWTPHAQAYRAAGDVRNDGACPTSGSTCSLLDSFGASLNVALYDVTISLSPVGVLTMARDAGIDAMWDTDRTRQDLRTGDLRELMNDGFGAEVGIGDYAVTVLDQANTMATYAARGLRAPAHFVRSVNDDGLLIYGEALPSPDGPRVLTPGQAADLTYALTRASGDPNLALKTGAWPSSVDATHLWSVGYTSGLGVAIWVGNQGDDAPLAATPALPAQILRRLVAQAHADLGVAPAPFPPPVFGGVANAPGSFPP
jgi:membrane peptidoglycan carboxypeptidase